MIRLLLLSILFSSHSYAKEKPDFIDFCDQVSYYTSQVFKINPDTKNSYFEKSKRDSRVDSFNAEHYAISDGHKYNSAIALRSKHYALFAYKYRKKDSDYSNKIDIKESFRTHIYEKCRNDNNF